MEDLFSLGGKTALVTGGTRGVGLMCAQALTLAGATVLVTSRGRGRPAVDAGEGAPAVATECITADLASEEGVRELGSELAARLDTLDILVNNAGVTWGAPLEEYPATAWSRVLQLNVAAPFQLVQETLPLLEAAARRDPPARVVNIGSIDGHAVGPFDNWAYPPSKAALHQMTRALAVRLGPRRITVNALAPGPIRTKMMAALLDESEHELLELIPLGRIANADDIAGALGFVTSRAGAFVTGQILALDGGASLARWGGGIV